ncbi:unnamed protein product [Protopolystoma xenopodis]|uniref:Dynein light chain n=1 Tax=Protopolystoma xenopodis TaxID=117903 RepID=A0A3S5FFB5_9PLAT|nr:unnamed protein product [Protopolystoma xenopodis]
MKELRGEQGGMKKEGDVAAALKLFLDKKYGRLWHVVLVRGSFWMNYSHEKDASLQFRDGPYSILVWKTSDQ